MVTQSLNFYLVSNPPAEHCGICYDLLNDGAPVVAHEGQGNLHPLHRNCMQQYAERPTCVYCNKSVQFDPDVLYTRTEKMTLVAKKWISKTVASMNEVSPAITNGGVDAAVTAGVLAAAKIAELSPLILGVCVQTGAVAAAEVRRNRFSIADRKNWTLLIPLILAAMNGSTVNQVTGALLAMGAGAAINKLTQRSLFPGAWYTIMMSSALSFLDPSQPFQGMGPLTLVAGVFSSLIHSVVPAT